MCVTCEEVSMMWEGVCVTCEEVSIMCELPVCDL